MEENKLQRIGEDTQRTPRKQKIDPENETILLYLHDIVYLLAGIMLVLLLLFRVVVVSGPSMMDTLVDGDCLVLVSHAVAGEPKYGDIVVVSKKAYKDGEPIIKRVIATEGQEVNIDFYKGIVSVDGVELDEPYVNTPTNEFEGIEFPQIVPTGCVFVLGDNRNLSKDSRSPEIGMIDKREILGKALVIALPGPNEVTQKRDFKRIGVLW